MKKIRKLLKKIAPARKMKFRGGATDRRTKIEYTPRRSTWKYQGPSNGKGVGP